ncbi:calpain-like cysteine peptidase [Strigomonas culicis]|uniref:Calpain-like cysteine peptidase n=1 Tax=Strigomonas culicis TaxID=28005 RepID=S9TK21_9TRYP|nr:calpain-like cysteine peptidase [Strigomonas culicis]|eukprot:EPY17169.1 calpain-like cysteine peptidase [Strigomonas culicis]
MGCLHSTVKIQGQLQKEPTYKGKYKFFGPSISGDVHPTTCENLYQVCLGDGWYFYNDTTDKEFNITVFFGPKTKVFRRIRIDMSTRASVLPQKSGLLKNETLCTVQVYPFETVPLASYDTKKGIDSFTIRCDASALSSNKIMEKISNSRSKLRKSHDFITRALKSSASQTLEATLKLCIERKIQFVDYTFFPGQESIERPGKDPHEVNVDSVQWMRSVDIVPTQLQKKVQLYGRRIKPKWVAQGYIGNCWFISALTIVSQYPSLTRKLFNHSLSASQVERERSIGAYRVWLNIGGWWMNIIVDNYLPTKDLQILFASSASDPFSLWVPLIEKAYAKAYGSYTALVGGCTGDGIRDLTGFPYFDVDRETCIVSSKYDDDAKAFFLH